MNHSQGITVYAEINQPIHTYKSVYGVILMKEVPNETYIPSEDLSRIKARLIEQIASMNDSELRKVAKSEASFKSFVDELFRSIAVLFGYNVGEVVMFFEDIDRKIKLGMTQGFVAGGKGSGNRSSHLRKSINQGKDNPKVSTPLRKTNTNMENCDAPDDYVAKTEAETNDTSTKNVIQQLHALYKQNIEQAREEYKAALKEKDEHIAHIEEQYKILLEARQDRLDDQKKYIEQLKCERDYLQQENSQLQQFINSLPWKVSLELTQDNDNHQD